MPDGYAHKYNGQCAMNIAKYKPRNYRAFVLGCNGPDPLFFYQMYNPWRKISLADLGRRMHTEKTGLFLQNLFRFAQTNAQKDYCLGFLCHYSLDSIMHPYINYITTAYGHPYNRDNGYCWFESCLDSHISHHECGEPAAHPNAYAPEIKKLYMDQIVTLFKQAVEATYTDVEYDRSEYVKLFSDFRKIKKALYSPNRSKIYFARIAELVLKHPKGYISCRMQPCTEEIKDIGIWRNNPTDLFCDATIDELFRRANQMSADYIKVGLEYFNGVYSAQDLLEDIGNKSYVTGLTIDN
ncbi:MAG: hypothetical protein IJW74_01950 [Oscillospiraceae bacterium]|nr:hypothetical protein [Oscillospiraceae bacterium]